MPMLTIKDVEAAFPWSNPVEIETKRGPRIKRECKPNSDLEHYWNRNKAELSALGVTLSEWKGKLTFTWWQAIDERVKQQRQERAEHSRATDAEIEIPCPPGLEYRPFQRAGIRFILNSEMGVLLADEMGLGKSQPVSTNVLTPTGWKPIGDIMVGDMVVNLDGEPTKVTGVFPQGIIQTYRVTFSDGTTVRCSPDHLWMIRDGNMATRGNGWKTWTTEKILASGIRLKNGNAKFEIPHLTNPVSHSGPPVEFCPYTLGQLIANGTCVGSTAVLTVNEEDTDIRERIVADWKERPGCRSATIKGWAGIIRSLGLNCKSVVKRIPEIMLRAPIHQRMKLLQGLMDGDGSNSRNRITYHTCSRGLADDVADLVRGLGGCAIVREYNRSKEGKPVEFQVNVKTQFCPFWSRRKSNGWKPDWRIIGNRITAIEMDGEAESVCIAVADPRRLYVTEGHKLTHNTIQVIGYINAEPKCAKVLIVCPAFLVLNWRSELARWLVRPMDIGIVSGNTFPTSDVLIISYSMLEKYARRLSELHFDLIAADEAHYVKNPSAKRSKVLLGYKPKRDEPAELASAPLPARKRIFATGTPICNRPKELWPLVSTLHPKKFNSWWRFHSDYCGMSHNGFGLDTSGASNLPKLQRELRETCMIRRLKRDVMKELPPKVRSIVRLPAVASALSAEAAAIAPYREQLDRLKAAAELAKAGESEADFHAAIARLGDGIKVAFQDVSKVRHTTALAKLPACIEHIHGMMDSGLEKLIVLAHHRDVIERLAEELKSYGCLQIHGGVSKEEKQQAVTRFQNDPRFKVIIVGNTMAVGITLTAASDIVSVEQDWQPAVLLQAEDRAHRIGQHNSVNIQYLVMEGSIDENMMAANLEKMKVIEAALDRSGGEPSVKSFDVAAASDITPTPGTVPPVTSRRSALIEAGRRLNGAQVHFIHSCLKTLAGACDFAHARDGAGFSGVDARIGHELAGLLFLTKTQAALALSIVTKYRRQLGVDVVKAVEELGNEGNDTTVENQ